MICKMCGIKETESDLCSDCKAEEIADRKSIDRLMKQGHLHHCACRLVWGDGECECRRYIHRQDHLKSLLGVDGGFAFDEHTVLLTEALNQIWQAMKRV